MSCSFHFVPHSTADSTQRQRELRKSDIRKHAAVVAHKRRITSTTTGPSFAQQPQLLSQHKALTWRLVELGGNRGPVVAAHEKKRRPRETDLLGNDGERSPAISTGFQLLSALDGSFGGAAMSIDAFPLRSNPTSSPSLILCLNQKHSAGAYRALRYCAFSYLHVVMH